MPERAVASGILVVDNQAPGRQKIKRSLGESLPDGSGERGFHNNPISSGPHVSEGRLTEARLGMNRLPSPPS